MAKARKPKTQSLTPLGGGAPGSVDRLLSDVRRLIDEARQQVARAVNAGLVTLYWHVGKRIREEILGEGRAAYGEQIVSALRTQLTAEYGRGFSRANLFHMIRFAEVFPDEEIVYALRRQLSWTHFRELIAIEDPLKREFYAEMELYLRWLQENETHPDEQPPIGLILCAGKSAEQVRLLQLETAGIRVAEYLTELPPRELLERKLHEAALLAREQLARQKETDHPESQTERHGKRRRLREQSS